MLKLVVCRRESHGINFGAGYGGGEAVAEKDEGADISPITIVLAALVGSVASQNTNLFQEEEPGQYGGHE